VFSSNRVVIAGLAFLAMAMCGCLLLVTTKLCGVTAGAITASVGAILFAGLCGSSCRSLACASSMPNNAILTR
jgi:hypothetical protein